MWTMEGQLKELQAQLEASGADRAARLNVIHGLQRQLEVAEADGVAQVKSAQMLRNQLEASEADRAARLEELEQRQTELAEVRSALGQATERVAGIESSLSWRWTRFLRWASRPLMKKSRDG
jgi:chromosome segregation ATPase